MWSCFDDVQHPFGFLLCVYRNSCNLSFTVSAFRLRFNGLFMTRLLLIFRTTLFRVIFLGVCFLVLGGLLFLMYTPFGGLEGKATATTRFADGTPAPCIHVNFQPLVIKGPTNPWRVRVISLFATTSGQGTWDSGGTWPYGEYQLTAFATSHDTMPLVSSPFTIWPMSTTHVDLVIDNAYQLIPLQQSPNGCLEALELTPLE